MTSQAEQAQAVLRAAGIDATVSAAGAQGEIAAVRTSAARLDDVAAHASAIRALGFRYVALELDAAPAGG